MPDRRDAADDRTGKSPDAYRTISEVSERLGVPQHVLRFWETRFPQIKPVKRAGGRRHYRPDDIVLLTRIRELLRDEGYSIKGVQRLLKTRGVRGLTGDVVGTPAKTGSGKSVRLDPALDRELQAILEEVVSLRDLLR